MPRGCMPKIRPICKAPLKEGKKFGPCLLWPSVNGHPCIVGEFDGHDWFNLTGDIRLHPRYFMFPLAKTSELDELFMAPSSRSPPGS